MASYSWNELKQAADDAGFSVIPAGTYSVSVKSAGAKKTGTGKDKINVQFTVTEGPFAGKPVFNDFIISPESGTAMGFFFRHMKALGLGPEFFSSNPKLPQVAAALVGRPCQLEVGIRVWNDEDRNEVTKVMPPVEGATAGAAAGPGLQAQPQPQAQPTPQPAAQPQPTPQPTSAPVPTDVPDGPELPF